MSASDYRGTGAAGSSLDLRKLTDNEINALEWGASLTGSHGPCWGWKITDYGKGRVEVLGVYQDEGHRMRIARKQADKGLKLPESYEEFVQFLENDKPKVKRSADREISPENIERGLRVTRKAIKEKCLMMEADQLLTFTTRAAITDSEIFRDITTRFLRYCRKEFPDFQYVAVFERHMSERTSKEKYGSLHLHVAISGFVKYAAMRHLWRTAVQAVLKDGDYEGANFDAAGSKRKGMKKGFFDRGRIAHYLAKYISKDMDDNGFTPGKRRYWSSRNIAKPEVSRVFTVPSTSKETFRTIFQDVIGLTLNKVFMPKRQSGAVPPIIWFST